LPEIAYAYYSLGITLETLDQKENALINFRKSVAIDSSHQKSLKSIRRVESKLKPDFESSKVKKLLDRALDFSYENELDKALMECEKAKASLPNLSFAYNYLGLIYQTLEKTGLAIEAYSTATQLNPCFTPAWENLSFAKRQLEAEQYLLLAKRNSEEIQELSETEFTKENPDSSDPADNQDLIPGWYYLDAYAFILPGTPGYRTRPGRSGYDKLDTDFELARVQGIIIKRLITGKFRSKSPFHLIMMTLMGLVFSFPLLGVFENPLVLINFSPYWITGLAFLVNVGMSFSHVSKGTKNKVFY
jgi:tetratricopeptide (TPR) repeat protein